MDVFIDTDAAHKAARFIDLARAYLEGAKDLLRLAAEHDDRLRDAATRTIAALSAEQDDLAFALSVVRRLAEEASTRADSMRPPRETAPVPAGSIDGRQA